MSDGHLHRADISDPGIAVSNIEPISRLKRAPERHGGMEAMRQALADKEARLSERDELLQYQENLGRESDHRLMNSLQMIVSLLSLQGRTTSNAEAAAQLKVAANRVAMIVSVHRRLHSFDDVKLVAFKGYLEDLCGDFATMLSPSGKIEQVIVVEGAELMLPAAIGIPLGFIVSELITNAAKHGEGDISVRLEGNAKAGYALSVSNAGSVLPEGFDPAAGKGLGMKIIRSFVAKIGGELHFGRNEAGKGTRFTVLFA